MTRKLNPEVEKKIREILEYVYSCDVRSDKLDKQKVINQALTAIAPLFDRDSLGIRVHELNPDYVAQVLIEAERQGLLR